MDWKKIGALCICAFMVLLSACSDNQDTPSKENTLAIMSKSEMENVKDGDTFSMPMEKDLDQEYLEEHDLIAVYSYSFTAKYNDGSTNEGNGYSAEAGLKKIENEDGVFEYKIESVSIKKILSYEYVVDPLAGPVGGAISNLAYVDYLKKHEDILMKKEQWWKWVLLDNGFACAPVISDKKKEELTKSGKTYIDLKDTTE